MNKFWVKNQKVHKASLEKIANNINMFESELIPISWFTRIFGCWHKKMGIPFTRGTRTFNTCMNCGACQNFDLKLWKNTGAFYYDPITSQNDSQTEKI